MRPTKNVLVQVTEAKRWNVTYGFGLEAQTGTPSRGMISEASCIQLGILQTAITLLRRKGRLESARGFRWMYRELICEGRRIR